jgi:hypothetical protein
MTEEQIKSFIDLFLKVSDEGSLIERSQAMTEVASEIQNMFAAHLLDASSAWHAFTGSSMKEGVERLPEEINQNVAAVISDLIKRKLMPLTR